MLIWLVSYAQLKIIRSRLCHCSESFLHCVCRKAQDVWALLETAVVYVIWLSCLPVDRRSPGMVRFSLGSVVSVGGSAVSRSVRKIVRLRPMPHRWASTLLSSRLISLWVPRPFGWWWAASIIVILPRWSWSRGITPSPRWAIISPEVLLSSSPLLIVRLVQLLRRKCYWAESFVGRYFGLHLLLCCQ